MKKLLQKKSIWQSVQAAMALALFVLIALASGGISQQKFKLPDGRYEIARYLSNGKQELIRGNVDSEGRFNGPVEIVYEKDFERTATEEVNMSAGVRHGTSKKTYANGDVEYWCYEHGELRSKGKCDEKSFASVMEEKSAFRILSYEIPWYAFKLDAFDYDSSYMKAYLDTLELLISMKGSDTELFDKYYDESVSELRETPYDSIIQLNSELSIYQGLDIILNHEFRLATLHSYMKSDSNTCNIVKTVYSNYLNTLAGYEVTETDFEGFCKKYDSIMSNYSPVPLDDPFIVDSLDYRMYRTMSQISSEEEESMKKQYLADSSNLADLFMNSGKIRQLKAIKNSYENMEKTPAEVSEIITTDILLSFVEGDFIRSSAHEAFNYKHNVIMMPTLVTNIIARTTPTSILLSGSILNDGGGEITSRGISWGTVYNPDLGNEFIESGSGSGDFNVSLEGLVEGEMYYARAFATNIAGTSYGNCLSFIAGSSTGIQPELIYIHRLNLYPNPASDYVILEFNSENSQNMNLLIYDLNGKTVRRKVIDAIPGENKINVDLNELQNGLYYCHLTGGLKIYPLKKLLINR